MVQVSKSLSCIKFDGSCSDLDNLFSLPSLSRIAPRIKVDNIYVTFFSAFFPLEYLRWIVALFFVCVFEISTNTYRMPLSSPKLAIKKEPADHVTQICYLNPILILIKICLFSWLIYFVYIRLRGWLLSVLMSQMWPGSHTRKITFMQATKRKKKVKTMVLNLLSFNTF